jgi:hypothetical protein
MATAVRMKSEDISQKTIRSYLIGTLDESMTEELDEFSVTSQEFADRVASEQYDLVDDWVAQRLDAAERSAFAAVLARSPTLGEKVRISQLMATAPRAAVVESPTPSGILAGFFGRMPKLAYGFAGFALLLGISLAIVYLNLTENTADLSQVAPPANGSANNSVPDLSAQPTDDQRADLSTPLPANVLRPDSSNKKPAPVPPRSAPRSFVAMVLSPPTRGTGEIKSVKVDSRVEYLELNVQTEAQISGRFVVEFGDPNSGTIEWSSAPARGRVQNGRTVVSVRVPSTRLKSGLRMVRLRESKSLTDVLDEHIIRIDR